MKKMIVFSLILTVALLYFACDKEDTLTKEALTEAVEKISTTETTVEDVMEEATYEVDLFSSAHNLLGEYMANNNQWPAGYLNSQNAFGRRYRFQQCPEVTLVTEPGGFPKTITLNYGDSTTLNNGRVLSGIIEIYITAPLFEDGSSRTVTYIDFAMDTIGISGTNVHVFAGDNQTERIFTVTGTLVFSFPNGRSILRESELVREWLSGLETEFNPLDDSIIITGTITLTHSDGDIFVKEIVDPLMRVGECRWIVLGSVEFFKNDVSVLHLDYGNGECDRIATLTYEGETHEILIGGRRWGNNH